MVGFSSQYRDWGLDLWIEPLINQHHHNLRQVMNYQRPFKVLKQVYKLKKSSTCKALKTFFLGMSRKLNLCWDFRCFVILIINKLRSFVPFISSTVVKEGCKSTAAWMSPALASSTTTLADKNPISDQDLSQLEELIDSRIYLYTRKITKE